MGAGPGTTVAGLAGRKCRDPRAPEVPWLLCDVPRPQGTTQRGDPARGTFRGSLVTPRLPKEPRNARTGGLGVPRFLCYALRPKGTTQRRDPARPEHHQRPIGSQRPEPPPTQGRGGHFPLTLLGGNVQSVPSLEAFQAPEAPRTPTPPPRSQGVPGGCA